MHTEYSCPHCKAILNPEYAIILKATFENVAILVGLHPEPGNYDVFIPHDIDITKGSKWDFFCPVCHKNLQQSEHEDDNLCVIKMKNENTDHNIFFSRVAGEKATYIINQHGETTSHGDASPDYSQAHMKYLY